MSEFKDIWYEGVGGLRLYARDYSNPAPRATVLCMHGLTRNSADFEPLCELLQQDYRLIAVDQRGRGRSEYDANPANYQPAVYVQDMLRLLAHLELPRVITIGTSMGGLMTLVMAAMQPSCLQASVINDIGPVVEPSGIERIKGYVGKGKPATNWDEAAEGIRLINAEAFPNFEHSDWLAFARRTYRETSDGSIELAYDAAIAAGLTAEEGNTVPPDLWALWQAMAPIPTLVIRGQLSDILSAATVTEMQRRKPDTVVVEVPLRGHAPILDEAEAVSAIKAFLREHSEHA